MFLPRLRGQRLPGYLRDNRAEADLKSGGARPGAVFEAYHNNQDREWEVLEFARTLDAEANVKAVESTSFGAGQTMGFNAHRVGSDSPLDMLQHYQTRERAQVEGIANYIKTIQPASKRAAVIAAAKAGDFLPLSEAYGPANPEAHAGRIAHNVSAMEEVVTTADVASVP